MKQFEKGGMPENPTPIKSDFSKILKISLSPWAQDYTVCEGAFENELAIAVPESWFTGGKKTEVEE